MSRTTKLELTQLLSARNSELEAARVRIAELEGDVAALKSQLAKTPAAQPLRPTRPVYTPRPATPEQLAFRAKLAAARELAITTGRCIRVEA